MVSALRAVLCRHDNDEADSCLPKEAFRKTASQADRLDRRAGAAPLRANRNLQVSKDELMLTAKRDKRRRVRPHL